MKRLYSFSIRSFAGPFLVTFAISMFILVMQFFWKYIDDLMGKGLGVGVIIELLFYVSASLIPLALPLSILLSSIMTFGNLSEHNELTALKSSGLSLYRIIKPLTSVVIIIAIFTFYFANYVIPVANRKWHSLIFDIQQTKIASILTPGAYSNELDGFAIKISDGDESSFNNIIIHDHRDPETLKTVRAETGSVYRSTHGKHLYFELKNGAIIEELNPQAPQYGAQGTQVGPSNTYPSRRTNFEHSTYKVDLTGFSLNRSDDDLFKDKHEMMNVFQISFTLDSIQKNAQDVLKNFTKGVRNSHIYLTAHSFKEHRAKHPVGQDPGITDEIPTGTVSYKNATRQEKVAAIATAQAQLRNRKRNLEGQINFLVSMEKDMEGYLVEFHRKFALTVAIIILFFIGAPLGAIVKRGGFGAPVVIAALLFMIYFVLITIGDNLAKSGTVAPWLAMWFASFVLAPIAIVLMRAAANDSPVMSLDTYTRIFKRKRK